MRKWPGLSETAVHVHHNVWWDLSGNPAKGPRTSLWRHFSVVMTPMQASSGWGISVCGHLNSSVTCGPVVPSQVVCSAVFLLYLNLIYKCCLHIDIDFIQASLCINTGVILRPAFVGTSCATTNVVWDKIGMCISCNIICGLLISHIMTYNHHIHGQSNICYKLSFKQCW